MRERIAVYAGTFDPLTIGHLWMIERGAERFDNLIVAIGVNPEKKCLFPLWDRLGMLKDATQQFPNVEIDSFENHYLISYAGAIGAKTILRGIRSGSDYEYERTMRNINEDLNPEITTVFLMPPRKIADVSSSMVKGLIGPKGWEEVVQQYVPPAVFDKLKEKYHA